MMIGKKQVTSFLTGAAAFLALATVALATDGFTFFGDAETYSPGYNSPTAVQLRSDPTPGWGGIDFDVAAGTTFADIDTLSTDYNFTEASCGGGSPRFQINLDTDNNGSFDGNAFVYIGPPPNYTLCPGGVWQNTTNLADPADFVDTGQVGGTFYDTFATAQLNYGSATVLGIQLVVDANWFFGGANQTVLVDNVVINNSTYTFENADSCKKDGWQSFTSDPGPFKNQGDCVSYFSTGDKNTANP
ncbi:hypothetical protein HYS94_04080 [Candidatus Daviesbacteria bacterium]|nr:hypothetical protein [Candidatus Daviesbacteria bacterium]